MTPAEPLVQLAEAASAAVVAALAELGVEDAQQGPPSTPEEAGSAFDGFDFPLQAATVSDDDTFGRATFVLTQSGATRLAAEAAGEGQPADIALIGEAMGTLAAAAATAVATALGNADAPPAPTARLVAEQDPAEAWDAGASVVVVSLTICEEPAALVLVVPIAILDRFEATGAIGGPVDAEACSTDGAIAGESLREVKVRLWAELGRTRMALGRAVGLSPGEVVELDAAVDDPVVIFVNGVRLGTGHLVVGDDGEWAFRVLEVSAGPILHHELEGNASSGAEIPTVDRKTA